jgi:hypothetical protein
LLHFPVLHERNFDPKLSRGSRRLGDYTRYCATAGRMQVDRSTINTDDEGARRDDARDRQIDPHGVAPARQADEDEPRAWPSSDRQKLEATTGRATQDETAPSEEPDVRPPHDTGHDVPPRQAAEGQIELPVPGYPNSEQALTSWFNMTYSRPPSERELGVLMNAMTMRDSTPPHTGSEPDPHGWGTTPAAPPATRR